MNTPAQRVAEDRAPSATHAYHAPPSGSTVDIDRCTECGCTASDSHHATTARVDEARQVLQTARRAAIAAIGGGDTTPGLAAALADLDGRIAQAVDLLNGMSPRPYLIAGRITPDRRAA